MPASVRASTVAHLHTALSLAAFLSALFVGCTLHYRKIVKNGVAGWPEEWFPSVSATIGDWYPERNLFQLLIALNAGPRFAVLLLSYSLTRTVHPSRSLLLLCTGIVRTLSCGGWVFVTSSDSGDVHDFLMILYIVCDLPWMWAGLDAAGRRARRWRLLSASAFWLSLVPMIYFYIQHKVHRIPGAYTRYAFFEWGLIFLDIAYDSTSVMLFNDSKLELTLTVPGGATLPAPVDGKTNEMTAQEASVRPVTVQLVDSLHADTSVVSQMREFVSFVSDVYLAYVSWTLITALPVSLFYFSIWKLALAGPEFTTLATLSPLLLAIPAVRRWVGTTHAQTSLSAFALMCLGVYRSESVVARLLAVAAGTTATCLRLAGEWDSLRAGYHALVYILGLLASSLTKHLNDGNNPLWPIVDENSGGHHRLLLTIGALALVEQATRRTTPPPPPTPTSSPQTHLRSEPWLTPTLALGAALYGLHERLSDPATLVAWSWAGFAGASTGPHPHTHAGLMFVACALGCALSALFSSEYSFIKRRGAEKETDMDGEYALTHALPNLLSHPLFFLATAVPSSYLLIYTSRWPAYIGGLLQVVFLGASFPLVLANAARAARARGAARVFGGAWVVWVLLLFAGTFTVAYAFVPGAGLFRERTDLVLGAQMLMLAPSFSWSFLLGGISKTTSTLTPLPALPSGTRLRTLFLAAVLSLAALVVPLYEYTTIPTPHPTHARARIFNAGIWTVHFGLDDAGRDSQRRMRDLIGDMQLEVVGLLETDLHRPVYGNRDLTRIMARELGYYVDIGPGSNKHTWGAVLLSKFPILRSKHHLLPSPDGELAPAIEAVLDVYGSKVTVVVAHNGQEETPLDRELQAMALGKIMRESAYPVVFLGYVVTKPWATRPAPYEIMVTEGRVHDIDDEDWDRWCEYIFYRGLHRTAYARVSRSTITDTELQIGQFSVPRAGRVKEDGARTLMERERRYVRSHKEDMPREHWFPPEYYGNEREGGVRGHFYHVFYTPLYYQIPPELEVPPST
ncbi:hypothetical protein PENSPDRAFT_657945 [Peniophora sp. CONT]|nr:hypothetical protein PENSPDRAFT_657945 [Peniophora sp. CONT]